MEEKLVMLQEETKNALLNLKQLDPNKKAMEGKVFDLTDSLKLFDKILEKNLSRLRHFNVALLFSGGIDSSILAYKLNQLGIEFQAILVAHQKEVDYKNAIEVSSILGIDLHIIQLTMENYEQSLIDIIKTIDNTDEKQVNISAPFFMAAKYMARNNLNVAVLGQGADELFCGYQRHVTFLCEQPDEFERFHIEDLKESVPKNFNRDKAIFSNEGITTYLPYLEPSLVELTLSVPKEILINVKPEPPIKKNFLRLYADMLKLDVKIIQKKKVAIQFGSGSYKYLRKIALKHGFTKPFAQKHGYLRHVQLYLDYLAQTHNMRDFKIKL